MSQNLSVHELSSNARTDCVGHTLSESTIEHCSSVAEVVISGIHDLRWFDESNEGLNTRQYIVDDVVVHPSYIEATYDNDLCFVKDVR